MQNKKIIVKHTPEDLNIAIKKNKESFTNINKDDNIVTTQPTNQNNSKTIIKKQIKYYFFLTVKRNIFKNKMKNGCNIK